MRRTIFITAVVVLATFLASIPAQSADGVACATITVGAENELAPTTTLVSIDDGLRWAVVGHFLWLQNADEASSLDNVVSYDLAPYEQGTVLTVCTDGIAQGEVISQGPDTALEQTTDTGKIIIYSTDAPHPEVAAEWVRVENGYLIK